MKKPFKIPESSFEDFYETYEGDLGVIRSKDPAFIEWFNCREEFQDTYPSVKRMLYYDNKTKNSNFKEFVKRIEKLIKLPVNKRIKWRRTNKKRIMYLSLGSFWSSLVHRSLLTILLRCGKEYDKKKDNWKAIIEKDRYLKDTPEAIKRFLAGYTKPRLSYFRAKYDYTDRFLGWVDEFYKLSKTEVEKKLVK